MIFGRPKRTFRGSSDGNGADRIFVDTSERQVRTGFDVTAFVGDERSSWAGDSASCAAGRMFVESAQLAFPGRSSSFLPRSFLPRSFLPKSFLPRSFFPGRSINNQLWKTSTFSDIVYG